MRELIVVEDVMKRDFPVINKNDTLEYAFKLMRKYGTDRIIALDDGRVVGIVTKKDIMLRLGTLRTRLLSPARLYVSGVMTMDPIVFGPSVPVIKIAKTMIDLDISSIPIVDENMKPIGIVTKWEIAGLLVDDNEAIENIMTRAPITIRSSDKLLHARKILMEKSISTLPVVDDNNRIMGIVTIDEIADALYAFHDIVPEKHRKERINYILVEDIMRLRPIIAKTYEKIGEVAKALIQRKMRGAVITDNGDTVVGIVTLTDLTRYFTGIT